MIYVPMLKTRMVELKVTEDMIEVFSDNIIPLVEIMNDKPKEEYIIDENTGEFIFEIRGKKGRKYKKKRIVGECTLEHLNSIFENKRLFIDYFRFSRNKYGNNIDVAKMQLSLSLNNDINLYKEKVRSICEYKNMIPVVSIKDDFDMNVRDLRYLLLELQQKSVSVALRITDNWLIKYEDIIIHNLRSTDYLLYDIGEQPPETKFMELEELNEINCSAKVILLNSPRKLNLNNKEYPEHGITDLIDTSARQKVNDYSCLYGYGDYCGLKDKIATHSGSNGKGAAIALLYDYNRNVFYSYVNRNTEDGLDGYVKVKQMIFEDLDFLDPEEKCLAIKKIAKLEKNGNWSTWHNITMTRYLHQVYMNL